MGSVVGSIMGGGSKGAGYSNKDVSGNIQNANKTFGQATDYGTQTFNAAKGINDSAARTLNQTLGEELPSLSNVNNYSRSNFDTYANTFQPLQAQQAKEAQDYTSGENIDRLRGRAIADMSAGQNAARQNAAMALAAEGVDPASIHGGALDRQAAIQGGAQLAGAANNSYLDTMNTGRALVDRANQLGMQIGGQGTMGAQVGSGIASNLVNAQTGAGEGMINNLKGADTYLNSATDANRSAADISHTANQDAAALAKAQSESTAGLGGALGGALSGLSGISGMPGGGAGGVLSGLSSVAPLAAMFMQKGGPVLPHSGVLHNGNIISASKGGPIPHKGALPVSPMPGSTDTVPVMATPGEFVIPKDVVDHKGNEFFHKLIDSTRVKMNERRAIPRQVFAHKSNH